MPELPDAKRARFQEQYGLSEYDARVLADTRARSDFFEDAVALGGGSTQRAKAVANWVNGDFARLLNAAKHGHRRREGHAADARGPDRPAGEGHDLRQDREGRLRADVRARGRDAEAHRRGAGARARSSPTTRSRRRSTPSIDANPKAVQDYRGGKEEAIKFLVGQVMKETQGRARPEVVTEFLKQKLNERP